jgi:hypothetical protein
MENWCHNDIRLLGSAERIEDLIRWCKEQVKRDESGSDALPLGSGPRCIHRVTFSSDGLAGDTKWGPPADWLERLTRGGAIAAALTSTNGTDGWQCRMLVAGGTAHELDTVRKNRDGQFEVRVGGGAPVTYLLPDPLPTLDYDAKRYGTDPELIREWRREVAADTIRRANEVIARDRLGPPIPLTETNRQRVNEILHQHDDDSPTSLILARLGRFERGKTLAVSCAQPRPAE